MTAFMCQPLYISLSPSNLFYYIMQLSSSTCNRFITCVNKETILCTQKTQLPQLQNSIICKLYPINNQMTLCPTIKLLILSILITAKIHMEHVQILTTLPFCIHKSLNKFQFINLATWWPNVIDVHYLTLSVITSTTHTTKLTVIFNIFLWNKICRCLINILQYTCSDIKFQQL